MTARVAAVIRRYPATAALLALIVVASTANALSGSEWVAPSSGTLAVVLAPVLSLLVAPDPLTLVVSLLGLLAVGPPAERLTGRWRTLAAYLLVGALGFAVGSALVRTTAALGVEWSEHAESLIVIDPFTAVAGLAMTASAFAGTLWRRRVRVLGFGVLALLVLYSGGPSDLYRLIAALLGLLLGSVLARRSGRRAPGRASTRHEVRTLLGLSTLAFAGSPLLTLLTGAPHGPLHVLSRLFIDDESPAGVGTCPVDYVGSCSAHAIHGVHDVGEVLLAFLPLAVLAVSGIGILRGRRAAAVIAAVVSALFGALEFVYYAALRFLAPSAQLVDPSVRGEEAIGIVVAIGAPVVVAVALLLNLRQFPVRADRVALRRFGAVVGGALVATAGVFIGGSLGVADGFRPRANLPNLLAALPERYVPVGFLHRRLLEITATDPLAHLLLDWTGPVFWAVLLVAVAVLIRARSEGRSTVPPERLRALLHEGGAGSISFMSTWEGNGYWIDPAGGGVVAFRRGGGVAIALGEPIGALERRAEAVRGFIDHCGAQGDIPAFYSVGDEVRELFTELGWQLLVVGEDAVIDAPSFTLEGGRWKDIRTSLNRAKRSGVEARWAAWSDLPFAIRAQISRISEEWLAGKDIPEMGFTLGGMDELRDPEVRLMVAVDADGRVSAFTSWLPTFHDGELRGWTLDAMRRAQDSANGVMEMLIAETVLRAQAEGLAFVSLSAAPLSRIAAGTPGSEGAARVLEGLGSRLERLYHFRSLLAYKLKFAPQLQPLYLAYPDAVAVPAIGVALVRAYLPGLGARDLLTMTRELTAR